MGYQSLTDMAYLEGYDDRELEADCRYRGTQSIFDQRSGRRFEGLIWLSAGD